MWPDLDGFSYYATQREEEARFRDEQDRRARIVVAGWAYDHGLATEEARELLSILGLVEYEAMTTKKLKSNKVNEYQKQQRRNRDAIPLDDQGGSKLQS